MLGFNQNMMTFEQIKYLMKQNPMFYSLVFECVQNPVIMNQAMNKINTLYYNPLILNQCKNLIDQKMLNMMNMMNMMNKGINNNFNKSMVTIYFRRSGPQQKPPIVIQCCLHDKVSNAIEKYRKESGDYEEEEKFIFNAKALYPSLTLEESGMTDKGNIFVVVTKDVKGG